MPEVYLRSVGLDRMIDQLDEMSRVVPERMAERMDEALAEGFAATQAALEPHRRTGLTAASGTVESTYADGIWEGRISYGIEGPEGEHATGAQWLLAQRRDDYLAPLTETSQRLGEIMDDYAHETW